MNIFDQDQLHAVAADSVRLDDITSSEHNRILLERIKDNDPSLDSVALCMNCTFMLGYLDCFFLTEEDNLTLFGHIIGLNTTLTHVGINYSSGNNKHELGSFFNGLSRNKTIETLELTGGGFNDCEGLSSMNMPRILKICSRSSLGENGAHNFALVLYKCKSLKEYHGILTAEILATLSVLPRIETVTSYGGNSMGWSSFDKLLKDTKTLSCLSIPGIGLGNRGLTLLVVCLAGNNTLKKCFLGRNNIGDEGVETLAVALHYNRSVHTLYLNDNDIGDIGAISLAKCLGQSNIRELSLTRNVGIADRGLVAIAGALQSHKCMLKTLRLGGINIGGVGMLLGRAISNSMLTSVDFSPPYDDEGEEFRSMGDDELGTLMEGLTHGSTLRVLDLSGNEALTGAGLRRHLHPYLSSKHCTLEQLDISRTNFGDEEAFAFSDALVHNESLRVFNFLSLVEESFVTDAGWNALSTALCDSTSANSVYLSNHTLQYVLGRNKCAPWFLVNRVESRSMIVKFKILHFFPHLDMAPPLQWNNLKVLPLVKSWFESMSFSADLRPLEISSDWERLKSTIRKKELSAIYKFIRATPSRVAFEYKTYFVEQLYMMQVMGN